MNNFTKIAIVIYGASVIVSAVESVIQESKKKPTKKTYPNTNDLIKKRIRQMNEQRNYDIMFNDIMKNNPDL